MPTQRAATRRATGSYRDGLHLQDHHAERYDASFRDRRTAHGALSVIERELLHRVVQDARPRNALDFACGTGRVLQWMGGEVERTVGVDVSSAMLARAAHNAPTADLFLGDVTTEPELITESFDLVTMFRFLLNAESELRGAALSWTARRLRENGLLLVNIHRNRDSLTGALTRVRCALGGSRTPRIISIGEATDVLAGHGFQVVGRYGYGYLPYGGHGGSRLPLPGLVLGVESWLAGSGSRARLASHLLLVARRVSQGAGDAP